MKSALIILTILIASCGTEDKATIQFLNEGLERNNEFLRITSDYYYLMINSDYQMDPRRMILVKERMDSVYRSADELISVINQGIQFLTSNKNERLTHFWFRNFNTKITNSRKLLIKNTDGDTSLINHINRFYPTAEQWQKQSFSIFDLQLLKSKLLICVNPIIRLLYEKNKMPEFSFRLQLKTFNCPEKTVLQTNESYKSQIFPSLVEEYADKQLVVNKDTISAGKEFVTFSWNKGKVGQNSVKANFIRKDGIYVNNQYYPIDFKFVVEK
jgi:hypothetical protein